MYNAAKEKLKLEQAQLAEEERIKRQETIAAAQRVEGFIASEFWIKDLEPWVAGLYLMSCKGLLEVKLGDPELLKYQALNQFCIDFRKFLEGSVTKAEIELKYNNQEKENEYEY
jgi:hypothetical protein